MKDSQSSFANRFVTIEHGQLTVYELDNRLGWDVGRPSSGNSPDIRLDTPTVSRQHGMIRNMDGMWFYLDKIGKNGTVYNGKPIKPGMGGRVRPIMLKSGDVFIFGGPEKPVIDNRTVFAVYLKESYGDDWRTEDTKGYEELMFSDGDSETTRKNLPKGSVIATQKGIAIYMGEVTYLSGSMRVQ
jgi:pSer/pThr/pTyr-binding forkhead associated (FHA) protein